MIWLEPKEGGDWPDMDVVFESCPTGENGRQFTTSGFSHASEGSTPYIGGTIADFLLDLFEHVKAKLNPLILADVFHGFDNYNCYMACENSPCFFVNDDLTRAAAVMPMWKD